MAVQTITIFQTVEETRGNPWVEVVTRALVKKENGMLTIRVQRGGEWMDELTGVEPVPALDHVYVLMTMQLGPPDMSWLLTPGKLNETAAPIRRAYGLECTDQQLFLQYMNWYERNQKKRTP